MSSRWASRARQRWSRPGTGGAETVSTPCEVPWLPHSGRTTAPHQHRVNAAERPTCHADSQQDRLKITRSLPHFYSRSTPDLGSVFCNYTRKPAVRMLMDVLTGGNGHIRLFSGTSLWPQASGFMRTALRKGLRPPSCRSRPRGPAGRSVLGRPRPWCRAARPAAPGSVSGTRHSTPCLSPSGSRACRTRDPA